MKTSINRILGGAQVKKRWALNMYTKCEELDEKGSELAANVIFSKLTEGKKPHTKKTNPHIITTMGPPGAGKSTLVENLIKYMSDEDYKTYVIFDWDSMLDLFTFGNIIRNTQDINGEDTGIGAAYGWWDCIGKFNRASEIAIERIIAKRYNVVLHTHEQRYVITAHHKGYSCTLFYIAVSKETAYRRTTERAEEIGRFIPVAAKNNNWGWKSIIDFMWKEYIINAAWFSQWYDNLVVVNNDVDNYTHEKKDFKLYDPHPPLIPGKTYWSDSITDIQLAIQDAHGHLKELNQVGGRLNRVGSN